MNEEMNGRMDKRMKGWMNEWMNKWLNDWINEWINEFIKLQTCLVHLTNYLFDCLSDKIPKLESWNINFIKNNFYFY